MTNEAIKGWMDKWVAPVFTAESGLIGYLTGKEKAARVASSFLHSIFS